MWMLCTVVSCGSPFHCHCFVWRLILFTFVGWLLVNGLSALSSLLPFSDYCQKQCQPGALTIFPLVLWNQQILYQLHLREPLILQNHWCALQWSNTCLTWTLNLLWLLMFGSRNRTFLCHITFLKFQLWSQKLMVCLFGCVPRYTTNIWT